MNALYGSAKLISISKLRLDPQNPRLPEKLQGGKQVDLAIALDMGFEAFTLAESIATHGYFSSEPMIVIAGEVEGEFIVVEGNRRLTAILGLVDKKMRKEFIDNDKWNLLAEKSKLTMEMQIPVVIANNRQEVVPVIGWRHISGILAWKPYPQARYIANLVDVDKMSVAKVAETIGMTRTAVADLYREQSIARQAKNLGVETGNMENAFSLLTVAMRNSKLRTHVGAPLGSQLVAGDDPIPDAKIPELKEVLGFIFGDGEIEPVISDSREISTLGNVVENKNGLAALRQGKSLAEAKQSIQNVGLSPRERTLKRLEAAGNALQAAGEDIAGLESDVEVVAAFDIVSEAFESIRSAIGE